MATVWKNIKGRVKWAKVYDPDEYNGDKRWKVDFYPFDEEEWAKLNELGLGLKIRSDEDGKFVALRRPFKKLFKDEVTFFTPPSIEGAFSVHYAIKGTTEKVRTYKKGQEIEAVGKKELIGNDSVVIVNICKYDTAKGPGHRLESIKVLDLVHFDPDAPKEDTTNDESASGRVSKVDPAVTKALINNLTTDKNLKEDMNDDVPW